MVLCGENDGGNVKNVCTFSKADISAIVLELVLPVLIMSNNDISC